MELGLTGKAAIVTGGCAGIGRAIALQLAREGADVAVVDCDEKGAASLGQEVERCGRRLLFHNSDVSKLGEAQRVTDETAAALGKVDILVCNAGITRDAVVWNMTEEQWDTVLAVNLKGTFNYCRAVSAQFMRQRHGKIVNIASINGLRGKFGQANYAASKGGVIALSKTLARELGKFNVNVNVVAPGMVLTEMMQKVPPELQRKALDETMLGRFAQSDDVADLVAFLASDKARHITGEVIKIDGGQYI